MLILRLSSVLYSTLIAGDNLAHRLVARLITDSSSQYNIFEYICCDKIMILLLLRYCDDEFAVTYGSYGPAMSLLQIMQLSRVEIQFMDQCPVDRSLWVNAQPIGQ